MSSNGVRNFNSGKTHADQLASEAPYGRLQFDSTLANSLERASGQRFHPRFAPGFKLEGS